MVAAIDQRDANVRVAKSAGSRNPPKPPPMMTTWGTTELLSANLWLVIRC